MDPYCQIPNHPTRRQYIPASCGKTQFEEILNGEAEKDIVNDSGYSPFLVACLFGSLKIAEFLMKKSRIEDWFEQTN